MGYIVRDVHYFQLVEKLLQTLLNLQGLEYNAIGNLLLVKDDLDFSNDRWFAIFRSIADISDAISEGHEWLSNDVISFLGSNDKTKEFVELLGDCLFQGVEFSWNLIRTFLAITCELSSFAYKRNNTFLSDNINVSASVYLKHNLQGGISKMGGWKAFKEDCVNAVLKAKECNATDQGFKKVVEHIRVTHTFPKVLVKHKTVRNLCNTESGKSKYSRFTFQDIDAIQMEFVFMKEPRDACVPSGCKVEIGKNLDFRFPVTIHGKEYKEIIPPQQIVIMQRAILAAHSVVQCVKVLKHLKGT